MVARANAIPAFSTVIGEIPFSPSTEQGRGFLAPFCRAVFHLGVLVSLLNEDEEVKHPNSDEMKAELNDAMTHLSQITVDSSFSTTFTETYNKTSQALTAAHNEISDWENEATKDNLRNLANRFLQLSSNLDREVLGIRNADPGYSL